MVQCIPEMVLDQLSSSILLLVFSVHGIFDNAI